MSFLDELLDSIPQIPAAPMLAGRIPDSQENRITWPKMGSLKIDGYRAIYSQGHFFGRSGKPHPAPAVKALAKKIQELGLPDGLDGELVVPGEGFNSGGGFLRRLDYSGPIMFWVFDLMQDGLKAAERYNLLSAISSKFPPEMKLLEQIYLTSLEDMRSFENDALAAGAEGIVLRAPGAYYKHGRGTALDQIMLKIKRYKSAEALVLEAKPRMHNLNEQTKSPLGYAERSSAKDGLVATDILGTLEVIGLNEPYTNIRFSIGSFDGLTDEEKRYYLKNPPVGEIVTYKYFPQGAKDKPRHPVFIGFRAEFDTPPEVVAMKEKLIMKGEGKNEN